MAGSTVPNGPASTSDSEETRRDWEVVQQNVGDEDVTERLRIQRGWLYRTTIRGNVALVFVPGLIGDN